MNKFIYFGILMMFGVIALIGSILAKDEQESSTLVIVANIYIASGWIVLALP